MIRRPNTNYAPISSCSPFVNWSGVVGPDGWEHGNVCSAGHGMLRRRAGVVECLDGRGHWIWERTADDDAEDIRSLADTLVNGGYVAHRGGDRVGLYDRSALIADVLSAAGIAATPSHGVDRAIEGRLLTKHGWGTSLCESIARSTHIVWVLSPDDSSALASGNISREAAKARAVSCERISP